MSAVEIHLGGFGAERITVDDHDLTDVRSFALQFIAGELPVLTILRDAFPVDLTGDANVTVLDPVSVLAEVWEFHRAWGEIEDADLLALWEDLGRILRGGAE